MPPGSGVLRMSIDRLGTQQRYFVSWIALECLTVLLKEQVEVADGESPAQSAAPGNQTRISRTRQTAGWTDFLSEGFLWITHCKYYHIVAFLHQPNGSSQETGKSYYTETTCQGARQSIRVIGCVVVGLHRILPAKNALCVHLSGTARGQNRVMDSTLFSSLLFWEQHLPKSVASSILRFTHQQKVYPCLVLLRFYVTHC